MEMEDISHKLAPLAALLIAIIMYTGVGGLSTFSTFLIVAICGVAAIIVINHKSLQPPTEQEKKQLAAKKAAARKLAEEEQKKLKNKEKSSTSTTSSSSSSSVSSKSTSNNNSVTKKIDSPVAEPAKDTESVKSDVSSESAVKSELKSALDDASDAASTGSAYKSQNLEEAVAEIVSQSSHDDSVSISSTGSHLLDADAPAIAPIPASTQPVPDLDEISSIPSDRVSEPDVAAVVEDELNESDSYSLDAALVQVTTAAEDEDDDEGIEETKEAGGNDLLEWEALQREAEAEAAKQAAAQAEQADADSLEALLADVEQADDDKTPSTATDSASTDKTEKAASFWNTFEEKTASSSATDAAGSEGDGSETGEEADADTVISASQQELPARFQEYSSSGVVKKGHVDIDSEDEEDEMLADTVISGSSRFDVGFADTKGVRSTMEDEMVVYGTFRDSPDEDYVAVFDGHGGSEASAVAAEELHELLATHLDEPQYENDAGGALKHAFESCQHTIEQAEPTIQSGTTAVVAYFQEKKGWVANAGDSRAVLCRKKGDAPGSVEAKRVTTDHKPSLPAEEARIKAAGGFVTRTQTKRGEVSRVCAILGVARALGDTFLQPMVTYAPDVFEVELGEFDVLILACDGLWDVVTDREASIVALSVADAGEAARRLRDFAFARGSDDNISVLVVRLRAAN